MERLGDAEKLAMLPDIITRDRNSKSTYSYHCLHFGGATIQKMIVSGPKIDRILYEPARHKVFAQRQTSMYYTNKLLQEPNTPCFTKGEQIRKQLYCQTVVPDRDNFLIHVWTVDRALGICQAKTTLYCELRRSRTTKHAA